jgi:transposase-like protein
MSDEEAEKVFVRLRFSANYGDAYCPRCGCLMVYACCRANGAPRWRCKACRKDFSVTSGTLFAFHKMPLRAYLMAVAIFANEVKGKSMLALSRDLGTQYETAFVLAHKIREAMASEVRRSTIGGQGKRAKVDGAYFGGYVKPANRRGNRRDRRLRQNQSGKRKVVIVIRERGGNTLPGVFGSEVAALSIIRRQVPRETEMMADLAPAHATEKRFRHRSCSLARQAVGFPLINPMQGAAGVQLVPRPGVVRVCIVSPAPTSSAYEGFREAKPARDHIPTGIGSWTTASRPISLSRTAADPN